LPAHRSRTENWRSLLDTVAERGGALEIAFEIGEDRGADVIWRVRVLRVSDEEIVVESPSAAGRTLRMDTGLSVVAALSVGQNRWMFRCRTVATRTVRNARGQEEVGLVLSRPEGVERCSRRQFFRISTAEHRLAGVECWPLLDPTSVRDAEAANRAQVERAIADREAGVVGRVIGETTPSGRLLPSVGPMFNGKLLNLSGGGLGLLLPPGDNPSMRGRYFWLMLDLRPGIPHPVAVTAKIAHTHLDSHQNVYAGMAFDFTFNPAHQHWINGLMDSYVQTLRAKARGQSEAA
jgi:hypothetical protein